MVEDEVNGDDRSPHVTYSHESLVHDVYPALLGENLEHGHECLQGRKAHGMRGSERRRGRCTGKDRTFETRFIFFHAAGQTFYPADPFLTIPLEPTVQLRGSRREKVRTRVSVVARLVALSATRQGSNKSVKEEPAATLWTPESNGTSCASPLTISPPPDPPSCSHVTADEDKPSDRSLPDVWPSQLTSLTVTRQRRRGDTDESEHTPWCPPLGRGSVKC